MLAGALADELGWRRESFATSKGPTQM